MDSRTPNAESSPLSTPLQGENSTTTTADMVPAPPSPLSKSVSAEPGEGSPDTRLEKEYHTEKVGTDESKEVNEAGDISGNISPSARGWQKSREKKHYRKDSNVSASDTEGGGSGKETGKSSSKAPPRKLKTFEPLLRKKEEEKAKAESEPTVTITGPGGEKLTVKKGPVHPNTNYDRAGSRGVSPNLSDAEEIRDIMHAQSLAFNVSPIDNSTPGRMIRQILRGDYCGMEREAKAKKRKLRTYFVATDLSDEAAYALEWTIGTILRDGDTLLAIMAVNEDTGTGKTGNPARLDTLELTDGAKAMVDTKATMERMTSEAQQSALSPPGSAGSSALAAIGFGSRARRDSDKGSKETRVRSKEEAEQLHAIDTITETCQGFLRKTRLSARVAVEILSCKSPKHMITEAVSSSILQARFS
ncbi:MAG: hypothetical protein Q9183_001326 [Haloplaca sp. 2 TL-2023]